MSAVDTTARSHLVVAVGTDARTREVAEAWVREAEAVTTTRLLVLDSLTAPSDRAALRAALDSARVGCRVLVAGGRYDVLQGLALAREAGAIPAELVGEITHTRDLPIYCAHCRDTFRVPGAPGGTMTCPGCRRVLVAHEHTSGVRGSYLASAASAVDVDIDVDIDVDATESRERVA